MRRLVLPFSMSGALLVACSTGAAAPIDRRDATPAAEASPPLERSTDAAATTLSTDPTPYVALGDSYTIGTSVRTEDRWPNQLVRALEPELELRLVDNLGVDGYTTADLIGHELPHLAGVDAELVSVLIGVNDVVQGVESQEYRQNVATILDELSGRVARRVLVVSTPDYTLTPRGAEFGDPERQRQRIRRFNEIIAEEADDREMPFVDISPVADLVAEDPTLVAKDGLHPSAKQYAGWVELIAPVVREMLQEDREGP